MRSANNRWIPAVILACAIAQAVQDQPPTFRTGANLVMVPVVVRDGGGNAVNTLRRKDFELFDKGKRREIVRFSVESEARAPGSPAGSTNQPPPPAAPKRFLAILFDDAHSSPEDMLRVQ